MGSIRLGPKNKKKSTISFSTNFSDTFIILTDIPWYRSPFNFNFEPTEWTRLYGLDQSVIYILKAFWQKMQTPSLLPPDSIAIEKEITDNLTNIIRLMVVDGLKHYINFPIKVSSTSWQLNAEVHLATNQVYVIEVLGARATVRHYY